MYAYQARRRVAGAPPAALTRRRAQPGAHGAAAGVAKLPVTARALVAASPTVTHDGAVVVGSRSTSAWALDARTGAVLRTFAPRAGARTRPPAVELGGEASWAAADEGGEAALGDERDADLAGALLLGRTEYTVRSLDAVTGAERWNVTFAELAPLGAAAAPLGAASADVGARLPLPPGGARLVLGADQTLRSMGPDGASFRASDTPRGRNHACASLSHIAHIAPAVQGGSAGRCT